VARDGEEALEWIRRWEAGAALPVVILLDLKLPRVNGLEVLRNLKTHPSFSAIPVVILTTSSEDSDVKTAYALGANSYIVKPVDFDKFQQVVQQVELYWNVINEPPR
jgi:CheY-like chemotaxis protein